MESGKKFWEIIDELKKEKISEGGRDEIRKIVEQVKTVLTCPLVWTYGYPVNYESALNALIKVLKKENISQDLKEKIMKL